MSDNPLSPQEPQTISLELARDLTPARVLVGHSGPAYRTATWLRLREDHAAARDAVHAEVDVLKDFGKDRIARHQLFSATTRANSKAEFLRRPDLGRRFTGESRQLILASGPGGRNLQIAIGDGLSAIAAAAQAPELLDRLCDLAREKGWSLGRPFFVRHCRVGIMNEIGDLLGPDIVVLLIGERPGLATAESLSAYLAFRPREGCTDAQRNLISNIHSGGIGIAEAARRVMALAEQFRLMGRSGVEIKEILPPNCLPGSTHQNPSPEA